MSKIFSSRSPIVKAVQTLFLVRGSAYIVFGILHLVRFPMAVPLVVPLLFFADAAVSLGFGFFLARTCRLVYSLAVAFIAVNIFLTILDQVGLVDILVMAFDGIILGLLLSRKKLFCESVIGTG